MQNRVINKHSGIKVTSRIVFIILNWDGWEGTVECLEFVYRIAYPSRCFMVGRRIK
jgi:hypothetical protein